MLLLVLLCLGLCIIFLIFSGAFFLSAADCLSLFNNDKEGSSRCMLCLSADHKVTSDFVMSVNEVILSLRQTFSIYNRKILLEVKWCVVVIIIVVVIEHT